MKTTVLKRKALVLSLAMAFIGAMTLTQCKKEKPTVTPTEDPTEIPTDTVSTPEGETVHITLKVNQDNDEKLDVNPPHVYFETGDVLFVASHGKYVGIIVYDEESSEFSGTITGATSGEPLYFYLLGNRKYDDITDWTEEGGAKIGCSFNISNQYNFFTGQSADKQLPVISYAPSNENFVEEASVQDFTAILHNKCALVKFNVIPSTFSDDITLQGTNLNDKVTVNFANNTTPFTYDHSSNDGGSINIGKRTDGYWAILLPHDGAITATASATGYSSATVTIPTINNNAYLSEGITVDFTTTNTSHTITVSANPSEYGSVSGDGDYLDGQSCTVTATPAEGYIFVNWTEGGTVVSTDVEYTFPVNADRNLVANFEVAPSYTITASANPTAGGTVTGGGEYPQGQSCTLTATANTGYDFDHWTETNVVVVDNEGDPVPASYTFTVNGNRNLVANFSSSGKGHR